jgi:hypothetical protein
MSDSPPDVRGKILIEGVEYQLVRIGAVPPWMESIDNEELRANIAYDLTEGAVLYGGRTLYKVTVGGKQEDS